MTSTSDGQREILRALIRAYVGEVRRLSLADLRRRQAPPWVSIGYGAAGVAYALWRVARRERGRARLALAHRWWRQAMGGSRWRDAFSARGDPPVPARLTAWSLSDGPAGLPFVGALIAHERGERAVSARQVGRFLDFCRPDAGRPPELLHGTAGLLVGGLTLLAHTADRRLPGTVDALARELLADPAILNMVTWSRDHV